VFINLSELELASENVEATVYTLTSPGGKDARLCITYIKMGDTALEPVTVHGVDAFAAEETKERKEALYAIATTGVQETTGFTVNITDWLDVLKS